MSVLERGPHEFTWQRPGAAVDGYGDASADWTTPVEVTARGFLQPRTGREVLDGRAAEVGDWLLLTRETGIEAGHRIVWDGRTFEVIGPPLPFSTPTGSSHVEVNLRQVVG